jgi:hypothetical protein
MSTISSTGKVGYIYNESTDTWHPISGIASTSADYSWSGIHDFTAQVTLEEVLHAQGGVNNFQNAASRDSIIPSPANGTVAFVRQDSSGNVINQLQYYSSSGSKWVSLYDAFINSQTSSYVLQLSDAGKTITVDSSSANTITIPADSSVNFPNGTQINIIQYGAGKTTISASAGVMIKSKYSNKSISAQYAGAYLLKITSNEWLLIGDLTA